MKACVNMLDKNTALVAQQIEQEPSKFWVAGAIPVKGTIACRLIAACGYGDGGTNIRKWDVNRTRGLNQPVDNRTRGMNQ